MSEAARYPVTRYEPSPFVDLADRAVRDRLGPAAVRAFFNIMACWRIKDEDAKALLGGMSNGTFYEAKKTSARAIDQDTLTRISYLIGIFKGLNSLYGEALADKWVTLANKNRLFGGRTPLIFMVTGGIPALQTVRRLLDARQSGM